MAEITASLVKELRERTGAGMMECKKALTENNGDIDAAAEALRNTRAVCRASYVHPDVLAAHATGELADVWRTARTAGRLRRGEWAALRLLGG